VEIKNDDWILPLYKIYTDDEDVKLITKVVKRGSNWAIGPEIEEFENSIKNYVGCDYCACLNSGTSSLHALLLAHNIKKGDEVIVPSFSFISTANAVLFVNASPVFTDIEEKTFGLDPKSIEQQINEKTKAIIPMDYGGMSCNIFEIKKIAEENKITLIEDAAEALGSSIKGKKVGSIADSSIFSFCGNKVLTTGEGGAVVTNDKEIFEKIKLIRSHGRVDQKNYFQNNQESEYLMTGYNWRMSSITATLGISQIKKLDKIIKMRQQNARYLNSKLAKFHEIKTPVPPNEYEHIYQMYTIRAPNKKFRDELHDYLTKKRIFSKIYFVPIHKTKFYEENFPTKSNLLITTEKIANEILTLPLYPNMLKEELNYLIDSISEFIETKN
jgi:perosamine synthetase